VSSERTQFMHERCFVTSTRTVCFRGPRMIKKPDAFVGVGGGEHSRHYRRQEATRAERRYLSPADSQTGRAAPPLMQHDARRDAQPRPFGLTDLAATLKNCSTGCTISRPPPTDSIWPDRPTPSTGPKSDGGDPTRTGTSVGP